MEIGRGHQKFHTAKNILFLGVAMFVFTFSAQALHNQYTLHDPSSIIKCGEYYWIFSTGNGIEARSSKDLIHWTNGPTPFAPGTYPSWVRTYVPDFSGHYWAPECFYMNGQYFLYYSCSSWGSRNSAIGVMTTKSLNPDSEDYGWEDQGVVVFSSDDSPVNCIDPAVFMDDEGKVWLTYGSHWDGIRIIELDSLNGKVIGGTHHAVASKGDYKTEAAYVINHGDYYYLFINRGQCCSGVNSTYYIQVGRSTSPTGPYLDKSGTDLYNGGGTTVLSTSDHMIGPGCLGYYSENGIEYVTYHYYDGSNSGIATLNIGTVSWDENDWPVFSNDWIKDGVYTVKNVNSGLVWDISGSGANQDPLMQSNYAETSSQLWRFESMGYGYYSIAPNDHQLVVSMKDCFAGNGIQVNLGIPEAKSCQIWKLERTGGGTYVLSSKYGNKILEVPDLSTVAGTELEVNDHTGGENQRWILYDSNQVVSVRQNTAEGFTVYPNPNDGYGFRIDFKGERPIDGCMVKIATLDGRTVFLDFYDSFPYIAFNQKLEPQLYIVTIKNGASIFHNKMIVQ